MLRIAHIINPVKVTKTSDLFLAQPLTFESMKRAKETATGLVEVELLTTQYPEDRAIIPDYFRQLPDLQRSVLDLQNFGNPRKYPLIKDILAVLYQNTKADYLVFTNVDIGLLPDFYLRVKEFIDQGHDALIINRRRLENKYSSLGDLPQIYLDKGKPHPGFDCFVFHRDLYPKFRLDEICVGIPFIGVTLAHNLFCFAKNFRLLANEWLTFHLGMDILPARDQAYYWYNRRQFDAIWKEYFLVHLTPQKLPYAARNFLLRYLKWALNPSLFVFKYIKIEMLDKIRSLFRKKPVYPPVSFEEIAAEDLVDQHPAALEDLFTEKKDGFLVKNFLSQAEVNTILDKMDKEGKAAAHTDVGFTYPIVFAELSRKIGDLPKEEQEGVVAKYFLNNEQYATQYKDAYGVDVPGKVQAFFEKIAQGKTAKVPQGKDGKGSYPFGTFRLLKPGKGVVSVHCGNYFQNAFLEFYAHLSRSVKVKDQLSYFILLNKAEIGGELSVFNLRWEDGQTKPHPGIDDFIFQPNGKKLFVDKDSSMQKVKVDPQPGDLILFQGGIVWHRVERVLGAKNRITFGGFMGKSHDGDTIYYWS